MIFFDETQAWRSLRLLENAVFAKHVLQRLHGSRNGSDSLQESAFNLSAHVAQARSFFDAAGRVPFTSQPLLFYYGILNFAKALIILATPSKVRKLEAHKHGVSSQKRKRVKYDYMSDTVVIQPTGVFLDWYAAVANLEMDFVKTSNTNQEAALEPSSDRAAEGNSLKAGDSHHERAFVRSGDIQPDSRATLGKLPLRISELWRAIPEAKEVLQVLNITSRCGPFHCWANNQGRYTVTVERSWLQNCGLTVDEGKTAVKALAYQAQSVDDVSVVQSLDHTHRLVGSFSNDYIYSGKPYEPVPGPGIITYSPLYRHKWATMPRISPDLTGVKWLCIPPLPIHLISSMTLGEPFIHYLLLFHLSMLQRYDAEQWLDLIGDSTTQESILIERLCDATRRYFPSFVAQFFDSSQ